MGRDVTLYPHKASRKELKDYLENLGFKKCDHFWHWPKGTLNYYWFDYNDFKSTDGISADIYKIRDEEKKYTDNEWALHVRARFIASWHDVKMFNEVLRNAKKIFGGIIKGDYGTNRYAPLWEDSSTPISRGTKYIFSTVSMSISKIKDALPDAQLELPKTKGKIAELNTLIEKNDPSRVIYNGLVPFAVSMIEYFFSEIFCILIKYDNFALQKKAIHKQKIDFGTVLALQNQEITIEEIIASNYTFQNLNQLNKAYKEWLDIDVRKILYKKKKIGKKICFLEHRIAKIIEHRHGVVHHFSLDDTLTKEHYINILDSIELSMSEFINFLERKYQIKIDRYFI